MNTKQQIDEFLTLIGHECNSDMREYTSVKDGHIVLEDQSIEIEDDQTLIALPKDLEVQFYYGAIPAVYINKCHHFKKLENIFTDSNGIFIENCDNFEEIGENVSLGYDLELHNLPKLKYISPDLVLREYGLDSGINIKNAATLTAIPQFLYAKGGFRFEDCPLVEEIPEGFANGKIYGHFGLYSCKNIKKLPSTLWIQLDCYIENCPLLTKLPDTLKIGKNLSLKGMKSIITLPENLVVKGDALLMGCSFTSLPKKVEIGGDICISADFDKDLILWIEKWKEQGMVKGEIKVY